MSTYPVLTTKYQSTSNVALWYWVSQQGYTIIGEGIDKVTYVIVSQLDGEEPVVDNRSWYTDMEDADYVAASHARGLVVLTHVTDHDDED